MLRFDKTTPKEKSAKGHDVHVWDIIYQLHFPLCITVLADEYLEEILNFSISPYGFSSVCYK